MQRNDNAYSTAARNLLLADELDRLVRALHQGGVDVVVLKGVPLTQRLFGRLDARPMLDNDLLVRRTDAQQARDVLTGMGYAARPHRTCTGLLSSWALACAWAPLFLYSVVL